jgi:hypothetical protein
VKRNDRRIVRVCAAAVASRFTVSCSRENVLALCEMYQCQVKSLDLTRQSVLFVVLSICGAPFYTFVLFLPSSWTTHSIALSVEGQHLLVLARSQKRRIQYSDATVPAEVLQSSQEGSVYKELDV